jgi:hypothetical protein
MNRRQFLLALGTAAMMPWQALADGHERYIQADTLAPSNSPASNSQRFQNAIDKLADQHAVLSIPPGDYPLNAAIRIADKRFLTIKAAGVRLVFNRPITGMQIKNSPDLYIEGLSIHYTNEQMAAIAPAVQIEDAYRVNLDRVHIWNTPGSCIAIKNSWWFSTQSCVFQKPAPGAAVVVQTKAMNNVIHLHTRFAGYRHVGPRSQCSGLVHNGGSGVSLIGCDFTGCYVGFDALRGRTLNMRDCYLERNGLGARIGSGVVGAVVENNYFNTKEGNTREPVFVHREAAGVTVRENVVLSCADELHVPGNSKRPEGMYLFGASHRRIETRCSQ